MRGPASPDFLPTRPPPEQRASPWTFRLAVLGVVLGTLAITLEAISLASRLAPQSAAAGGAVSAGTSVADSPPAPQEALSESPPSASADVIGDPVLATPLLTSSLLDAAEDRMLGRRSALDDPAAAAPTSLEPLVTAEPRRVAASGVWPGGKGASPGAEDDQSNPSLSAISGLDAVSGRGGKRGGRRGGGERRGDLGNLGRGGGGGGSSWDAGGAGGNGNVGATGATGGDDSGGDGDSQGGGGGGNGRPNLVLLIADDAALGDINAFRASSGGAAARAPPHFAVGGAPHGLTPNLDAMARKGVRYVTRNIPVGVGGGDGLLYPRLTGMYRLGGGGWGQPTPRHPPLRCH